jgi:hypothetical protein
MDGEAREKLLAGWQQALARTLSHRPAVEA